MTAVHEPEVPADADEATLRGESWWRRRPGPHLLVGASLLNGNPYCEP